MGATSPVFSPPIVGSPSVFNETPSHFFPIQSMTRTVSNTSWSLDDYLEFSEGMDEVLDDEATDNCLVSNAPAPAMDLSWTLNDFVEFSEEMKEVLNEDATDNGLVSNAATPATAMDPSWTFNDFIALSEKTDKVIAVNVMNASPVTTTAPAWAEEAPLTEDGLLESPDADAREPPAGGTDSSVASVGFDEGDQSVQASPRAMRDFAEYMAAELIGAISNRDSTPVNVNLPAALSDFDSNEPGISPVQHNAATISGTTDGDTMAVPSPTSRTAVATPSPWSSLFGDVTRNDPDDDELFEIWSDPDREVAESAEANDGSMTVQQPTARTDNAISPSMSSLFGRDNDDHDSDDDGLFEVEVIHGANTTHEAPIAELEVAVPPSTSAGSGDGVCPLPVAWALLKLLDSVVPIRDLLSADTIRRRLDIREVVTTEGVAKELTATTFLRIPPKQAGNASTGGAKEDHVSNAEAEGFCTDHPADTGGSVSAAKAPALAQGGARIREAKRKGPPLGENDQSAEHAASVSALVKDRHGSLMGNEAASGSSIDQ